MLLFHENMLFRQKKMETLKSCRAVNFCVTKIFRPDLACPGTEESIAAKKQSKKRPLTFPKWTLQAFIGKVMYVEVDGIDMKKLSVNLFL